MKCEASFGLRMKYKKRKDTKQKTEERKTITFYKVEFPFMCEYYRLKKKTFISSSLAYFYGVNCSTAKFSALTLEWALSQQMGMPLK